MTQEQMDRLDYLTDQKCWSIEELGELNRLRKLFHSTFRIYVCVEDLEQDDG